METAAQHWNHGPSWGHTSEEKARIGSKTGAKHVWSCCIKAITLWEKSSTSRGLPRNLIVSLTPPLQQQLHWSLPPCVFGCGPIHLCYVPAQTHTLLIYTQAPLSNNPRGFLHQPPSTLLSPPLMGTSAEIQLVVKALINMLWLRWGKRRGRKAMKQGGDYIFL